MLRSLGFGLSASLTLTSAAVASPVTTYTLDNGLQVVVIEDHRAPAVVQMVWYKVGSADEPAGVSGIAHFLEHLMFKGTDEVPSGGFSDAVSAQGGRDNAFTSFDYTAYHQRVASDRLDLIMRMEADRMRDLVLAEADVVTERQVILEERSQRTDSSPGGLLNEQMAAAQFLNHSYGIPIIGWRHEMEALSREDALAFYKANYAPNNAILVVAGDVEPAEVLDLAKLHYGPLEPSDTIAPRVRPQDPPQLAARRVVLEDARVSEPYVLRTYLGAERNPGDQREAAALTLLAEVLGGSGTTSVMARALQFDTQVAVYATAYFDPTTVDRDTFGVVVMPAPGVTLTEAEAAMDKVLADFMAKGVDPADLDRIKTQIRAEEIYGRDDTGDLAQAYGEGLSVGLTVEDVKAWPGLLQEITGDEVVAAAKKYLVPQSSVTGWLQAPAATAEKQP
ncbi:MAG: M16 family metallopeptidase [Paracoccaceae bacterium]